MLIFFGDMTDAQFNRVFSYAMRRAGLDLTKTKYQRVLLKDYDSFETQPRNSDDVVICCSPVATQLYVDRNILKKNQFREHPKPANGGWVLGTLSPGYVLFNPERILDVIWDIKLAKRLQDTGEVLPKMGSYKYVKSIRPVIDEAIKRFDRRGSRTPIAIDLETMGLNPFDEEKKIVTLQLAIDEGRAYCVYTLDSYFDDNTNQGNFLQEVDDLLNNPKITIRGANLKFDLLWIRMKWHILCSNFRMDTMLVGTLLNESRSNSLKWHAKEYTDLGGYEKGLESYDIGNIQNVPKDVLLPYAAGDADVTLRVSNKMVKELEQDRKLFALYNRILHPASRVFEEIEYRGVYVDKDKFVALEKEFGEEMAKCEEVIKREGSSTILKAFKADVYCSLALQKGEFIRRLLFTPEGAGLEPKYVTKNTREVTTATQHLKMFLDNKKVAPLIEAIIEWKKLDKVLKTYVQGFMKYLQSDGRFHPSYSLGRVYNDPGQQGAKGGTVSGRLTATAPAIQTLPKHSDLAKKLRKAFIAPAGFTMFEADFSQAELRIVCCLANEKKMIDAYLKGIDLHKRTGAIISGVSVKQQEEWAASADKEKQAKAKHIRQSAKSCNFGAVYGISPEGFKALAKASYGVEMTLAEAKETLKRFFDAYSGLKTWQHKVIMQARKDRFVVNPFGRKRRLSRINSSDKSIRGAVERQAVNSPVQSALTELTNWALVEIQKRMKAQVWLSGMIHDAIIGYYPSHYDWVPEKIVKIMSTLPIRKVFGWNHQVPFTADISIGDNWADLEELEISG